MARQRRTALLAALLAALLCCSMAQTKICPDRAYTLHSNQKYCYQYFATPLTFFAASTACRNSRGSGGELVDITSAEENLWLREQYFAAKDDVEFWIGLNDVDVEGLFVWRPGITPSYTNWVPNFQDANNDQMDCVEFATDGWMVHSGFCGTSKLPFVCKSASCDSNDGNNCIGSEPTDTTTSAPSGGIPTAVVAVIIIIVVAALTAVVILVVLFLLYKYKNDAFYRYCCCCLQGGSKAAMHSLQQENQRLRHELSQRKLSSSGRFAHGQFANEISGVPDGRGGVLPTIKQPLSAGITPSIPEDRAISFSPTQPPPLIAQRSLSVTRAPVFSRHPSTTQHPTPGVFLPTSPRYPATLGGVARQTFPGGPTPRPQPAVEEKADTSRKVASLAGGAEEKGAGTTGKTTPPTRGSSGASTPTHSQHHEQD